MEEKRNEGLRKVRLVTPTTAMPRPVPGTCLQSTVSRPAGNSHPHFPDEGMRLSCPTLAKVGGLSPILHTFQVEEVQGHCGGYLRTAVGLGSGAQEGDPVGGLESRKKEVDKRTQWRTGLRGRGNN